MSRDELLKWLLQFARSHPEDTKGQGLFAVLLRMRLRLDAGECLVTNEEWVEVVHPKCFKPVVRDLARSLTERFGRGGEWDRPDPVETAHQETGTAPIAAFLAEQRRQPAGIQMGYSLLSEWFRDERKGAWADAGKAVAAEDPEVRDAKAASYLITSGKHWLVKQILREKKVFDAVPLPDDSSGAGPESDQVQMTPQLDEADAASSPVRERRRVDPAVEAVICELTARDRTSPEQRPEDPAKGREARYLLDFDIWAGCTLLPGPLADRLRAQLARRRVREPLDRYSLAFFEAWSGIPDSSVSEWRGPRRTRLLARGAMAFYGWTEEKAEVEIALQTRRAADFLWRLYFALRVRFLHRKPEFVRWEPLEIDQNEQSDA